MDKKTPLAALLLLAFAVPAAAEFCTFDGGRTEIVVRRLKGAACTMENALVFNSVANQNRYGADESVRTFLTDDWPGWGGGDKKCAAARKTADSIVYGDETYILGKAVLLGPQVWKVKGSCDWFASRFRSTKASLGEKPSHEDVFEALGAERISMGELAERLMEGRKK